MLHILFLSIIPYFIYTMADPTRWIQVSQKDINVSEKSTLDQGGLLHGPTKKSGSIIFSNGRN